MAGLILPDDKMEIPGLMHPGRVPVGNVKVDISHKYGQYCINALIGTKSHDLIAGLYTVSSGASTSGGTASFDGTPGNALEVPKKPPVSTELTILTRLRRITGTHDEGIFSDKTVASWSNDQGFSLSLRTATSGVYFRVGSGYNYKDNAIIALGEWFDIAVTWSAGEDIALYINGDDIGSTDSAISSSFTTSDILPRIGTYYDNTVLRSFEGDIKYCFVLNNRLNQSSIRDFRNDPMQMLISA